MNNSNEYKPFQEQEFSQAIRGKRRAMKLSETELSLLAGVSRSTIQKIEAGNTDISFGNIKKVVRAVGLELGWK